MKLFTLACITVLCIMISACKKENNKDTPSINIIAPAGFTSYNVFDTVKVTAQVSDPAGLKTVSVYIMNSANIQVLQGYQVQVTSNNMTFTVPLIINNIHLPSGNYFVAVNAYNGANMNYAYRQIYIAAAPQKRVAVYAITRAGTWLQGYTLDSALHSSTAFTVAGNYAASDVNSYYQQLYIVPLDTGNASALNVPANSFAWSLQGINSPAHYFTNVYSYGNAAYVSLFAGFVKFYNSTGVLQMQINTDTAYYPVKTLVWNNFLFVEEKSISSPGDNLVVFYQASGMGYQQLALPSGSQVAMFGYDINDLLVAGNQSNGMPYLLQYNISANTFFAPVALPSSRMLSAVQINSNTYLLSFADQTIYQYTWSPNAFSPFMSGVAASKLRYDAVNNEILAAAANTVKEYTYPGASLLYSASLGDSVLDIQILYNH